MKKQIKTNFLKWVGNKSQLLKIFEQFYPNALKNNQIENYYEPFLGSGAVFFDIASKYKIKNYYLYDINDDIIIIFQILKFSKTDQLIHELTKIYDIYINLSISEKSDFFYEKRCQYNKQLKNNNNIKNICDNILIKRAALFLFLNKNSFRGIYRVNKHGEYNVPWNKNYRNFNINKYFETIYNAAQILKENNVIIEKVNFIDLINKIKNNSFVYFDPPYYLDDLENNNIKIFTQYSINNFLKNEQIMLYNIFDKLNTKYNNIYLMLSNANSTFIKNLYNKYNIISIPVIRNINLKNNKKSTELIITNYII